jgi:zinc D-Ala-D-Ala carboxypeptidase
MRKLLLVGTMSTILFTSACDQAESYLGKVPFIKNKIQNEPEITQEADSLNDETEVKDNQNADNTPSEDENIPTLEDIFFNQIKEVNGEKVIQNPQNMMVLVNKQFALPGTYIPGDLVRPNVNFSFGNLEIDKSLIRKEAALALEKLFSEASKNGVELFAVSGYRSYEYQDALFSAEVSKVGKAKAIEAVAYPGQSEHQTGLAMDISSKSEDLLLTESFGETIEGKWLAENAHRFGYILRYPKGKEAITGYQYEAWHFRYVGIQAATIIYQNKWTLEEYFQTVKKI